MGNHNSETARQTVKFLRMDNPELAPMFLELTVTAADNGTPCQQNPDIWWDDDKRIQQLAVNGCGTCPLKTQCGEWAVTANEREGVWGGMTPGDRALLRRRSTDARRRAQYAQKKAVEEGKPVDPISALALVRQTIKEERGNL